MSWKPYCYEESCHKYTKEDRIEPHHGPCCTCQVCGYNHDECICQFFEEPCISCPYRECDHVWEPISTDRTKSEWVAGLGDHPEICRKCGTLRSGE